MEDIASIAANAGKAIGKAFSTGPAAELESEKEALKLREAARKEKASADPVQILKAKMVAVEVEKDPQKKAAAMAEYNEMAKFYGPLLEDLRKITKTASDIYPEPGQVDFQMKSAPLPPNFFDDLPEEPGVLSNLGRVIGLGDKADYATNLGNWRTKKKAELREHLQSIAGDVDEVGFQSAEAAAMRAADAIVAGDLDAAKAPSQISFTVGVGYKAGSKRKGIVSRDGKKKASGYSTDQEKLIKKNMDANPSVSRADIIKELEKAGQI